MNLLKNNLSKHYSPRTKPKVRKCIQQIYYLHKDVKTYPNPTEEFSRDVNTLSTKEVSSESYYVLRSGSFPVVCYIGVKSVLIDINVWTLHCEDQ